MDNDKVNAVLDELGRRLAGDGAVPIRHFADKHFPASREALNHALWMVKEARNWPVDRIEKKMRWLGCVQGILWSVGGWSIEQLKEQNKPPTTGTTS